MLKIFIGYDPREAAAYHTLCHSIIKRASAPVAIIPLVQSQLRAQGIYTREIDTKAATEFSLTRFLVPYLSGYEGVSIFMDCDMVVKCDLVELALKAYKTTPAQVSVCKHDYVPKNAIKMDGQVQAAYPRKNWSSFMIFDCATCRVLTPEYVNSASPADLHRFVWADEKYLGSLPLEYNWLVGEYPKNDNAKILHYTEGGPWFWEYRDIDHARDWQREHDELVPPPVWHKDSVREFPKVAA